MDETSEIRQARHRASIKWLLSKAYNNRVPDNLKEPFYRDHENQERLKPKIVVDLGNATLYCQTLSNLYSDPNYQSLNHWSILQTLARKGVPVNESKDMPLTETVLIQTNPLKMVAHMAVVESLMSLYAKEITSNDRVGIAIKRISGVNYQSISTTNTEEILLSWVSHTCAALKKRIECDISNGLTDDKGKRLEAPDIPPVRNFQDLCDGICLALLISYYCPKEVQWTDVRINYLPAVEDSIHNVLIVSNFSQKHLPYNVFHMLPEDVTYMRGSMKLNLLLLLADLFNLFEIHPAKCVSYPNMDSTENIAKQNAGANEHGIYHRRGLTKPTVTPIPDLRSDLDQPTCSPTTRPQFQVTYINSSSGPVLQKPYNIQQQYASHVSQVSCCDQQHQQQLECLPNAPNSHCNDEVFTVHKSRGITTLSSMHMQQHQNQQQQQDPLISARLRQPKENNNYETKTDERGDYVAAGRPSNWDQNRRPSYAGRRSRRNSSSEDSQLTIENFGGSQDQLNAIDRFERDRDRERKLSNTTIEPVAAVRSSIIDARGTLQLGYDTDSGSEKQDHDTEKQKSQQHQQQDADLLNQQNNTLNRQSSYDNVSLACNNVENRMTMANTNSSTPTQKYSNNTDLNDDTPSQQQQPPQQEQRDPNATLTRKSSNANMHIKSNNWQNNQNDYFDDDTRSLESAYKLSNIRLKLEEKRRMIEQDKRKIEMALMRYHEKVNQDDLEADYMKWETISNDSKRTSDVDPTELDKYQQSIAIMNMNLQDIQLDIQRLATQQNQIQAQQMQAQQLLQAQQISNMLNQQQQNFGSQQHLADPYSPRPLSHQPNYGSSPHLPQAFNNSGCLNPYGSRPPSRDPYQQQQSNMPMQYMNDTNQYIYGQPQATIMTAQPPPTINPYNHVPMHYNDNNGVPYNNANHTFMGAAPSPFNQTVHAALPLHHPHVTSQQQSYIPSSRQSVYDDYAPVQSMLGREPNVSPQPNNYYQHDLQRQQPQQQLQQQLQQQQQQQLATQQAYPSQRRTWAQSSFDNTQLVDINTAWQSTGRRPTSSAPASQKSDDSCSAWDSPQQLDNNMIIHQHRSSTLQQNGNDNEHQQLYPVHSSPIHNNQQRQQQQKQQQQQQLQQQQQRKSNNVVQRQHSMTNLRDIANSSPNVISKPSSTSAQPDDMMAPQSICFIGDEDDVDELERNIIEKMQNAGLSEYGFPIHHSAQLQQKENQFDDYNDVITQKLNITSGNLTYRIPSPQRPQLHANSFQDPRSSHKDIGEKGFYISFDDEQPKRPKPPLRAKRSPKKEKSLDNVDHHRSNSISLSGSDGDNHNDFIINSKPFHGSGGDSGGNIGGGDDINSDSQKSNINNINKATYNKYTDSPIQLSQVMALGINTTPGKESNKLMQMQLNNINKLDSNQLQTPPPTPKFSNATSPILQRKNTSKHHLDSKTQALIVGSDASVLNTAEMDEMERRKEKIMLMSLQRRQRLEEAKELKEKEAARKRELEREKEEEKQRKKEEQIARRAAILEQHRLKKAMEEAEREGKTLDRSDLITKTISHTPTIARTRTQKSARPRPKTIHVDDACVDISEGSSISSRGKKGSNSNITVCGPLSSNPMKRDLYKGSQDSLTVKESPDEYPSSSSTPVGRRGSYKIPKDTNIERGRALSRISVAKGSSLNFRGRKSNSLMNLCDSGIGRATPPRRAPSPGIITRNRQMPSPSGPGSLPPGLISKRRGMDDGSSDISSTTPSSMMEYSGPKLYKQPAAKSNRSIILNAVEYCVFPGAVNRDAKQKVLEKIARSEAKHFLVLFRDSGCQFRALYSYAPETEQVCKLYGTGPSHVDEVMFDKFFKYNSGGKCFSQVYTKHLTVTIDAFTIHNSLWQGKKLHLPSKKDMALVI